MKSGRRSRCSAPTSMPAPSAVAREGRFPAAIEADVSEERLRRFFLREGDHYRVRQELRDLVLFAAHEPAQGPAVLASRPDFLPQRAHLSRSRACKQQVCSTFHYALNPGGFLFLGSSETADHPAGLFHCIDRNARIYRVDGDIRGQTAGCCRGFSARFALRAGRAASDAP